MIYSNCSVWIESQTDECVLIASACPCGAKKAEHVELSSQTSRRNRLESNQFFQRRQGANDLQAERWTLDCAQQGC
jgi:hypothetical protein